MMMTNRYRSNQGELRDFSHDIMQLLSQVHSYMTPPEVERVKLALALARETCEHIAGTRPIPPLEHALAVATILTQMHIDAIGVAAGLVFEAVDADLLPLERVERALGTVTAHVVGSMERFNILERKKQSMTVANAANQNAQL